MPKEPHRRTELTPSEKSRRIVELYNGGVSARAVARQLGISPKTVARTVRAAGVARSRPEGYGIRTGPKPIAPAVRAAALADYEAGLSAAQVAEKHGVSESFVHDIARDAGTIRTHAEGRLRLSERRYGERWRERIVELSRKRLSARQVAAEIGCSATAVLRVLHAAGAAPALKRRPKRWAVIPEEVKEAIQAEYLDGATQAALAAKWELSAGLINRLVSGLRDQGEDEPEYNPCRDAEADALALEDLRREYGVPEASPSLWEVDDWRELLLWQAAEPSTRDLTAAFFGDPPPGRSALDMRRARA